MRVAGVGVQWNIRSLKRLKLSRCKKNLSFESDRLLQHHSLIMPTDLLSISLDILVKEMPIEISTGKRNGVLTQLSCSRERRGLEPKEELSQFPGWRMIHGASMGIQIVAEHEMGMLLVVYSIQCYISYNYPSIMSLITNVLQDNKPPVQAR
jgi:hypothetical protein